MITENYKVLTPAYGRDYRNKAPWNGKPCSISNFKAGIKVEMRYNKLQSVTIVTV